MAQKRKSKRVRSRKEEHLNVKIEKIEDTVFGKRLVIKLPRMRKSRRCTVMPVEKKEGGIAYILQADKFIMEVDPKTRTAIYNTKCEYFPCLNPLLGAKKAKVSKEFIKAVEEVAMKKGDLIGIHPEGSPIYFAGGKEI